MDGCICSEGVRFLAEHGRRRTFSKLSSAHWTAADGLKLKVAARSAAIFRCIVRLESAWHGKAAIVGAILGTNAA